MFFKKASYFLSLLALLAFDSKSAIDVNFTLNLLFTALYANAIAKCVFPTPDCPKRIIFSCFLINERVANSSICFSIYSQQ